MRPTGTIQRHKRRRQIEVLLVMPSLIKSRLRKGQEVRADLGCIVGVNVAKARANPTNWYGPIQIQSADLAPGWHDADRVYYPDVIELNH